MLADARAGSPEKSPLPPTTPTEPLDPGMTITDTPMVRWADYERELRAIAPADGFRTVAQVLIL